MSDERIMDEGTYAEMCQPHVDLATAEVAQRAFASGVRRLRKKYRIANLLLATQVFYRTDDGTLAANVTQSTCGSDLIMPRLARGLNDEWAPRGQQALIQAFLSQAQELVGK